MSKTFYFILLLFVVQNGFSQSDTSVHAKTITANYKTTLVENGQSRLYNGFEYRDFPHGYFREGHQFFGNGEWNTGSVTYEGVTYTNIPILYDLVKNELIIRHVDKISKISLLKPKVQSFSFSGHTFINLTDNLSISNLPSRFYDQLYADKIIVLAKRDKKITETIVSGALLHGIYVFNKYYVKKDSVFHTVNSKGSLLKILKDKKPALQKYIKANNLKYKRNPEKMIVNTVAYYDEISK